MEARTPTPRTCARRSSRPKNEGCPPSKSLAHSAWVSPPSSATPGWLGKGDRSAPEEGPGQRRPKADERARRLLQERTCGSDPPPPSPRGASTCVPAERGRGEGERLHRQQAAPSHGMDPKKRRVGASERDEFLRAAWRALVAGEIGAERLVFVEEMGSNTSLAALYAWSRRGDRARCSVPRNRAKNTTTLLASMTSEGMGLC